MRIRGSRPPGRQHLHRIALASVFTRDVEALPEDHAGIAPVPPGSSPATRSRRPAVGGARRSRSTPQAAETRPWLWSTTRRRVRLFVNPPARPRRRRVVRRRQATSTEVNAPVGLFAGGRLRRGRQPRPGMSHGSGGFVTRIGDAAGRPRAGSHAVPPHIMVRIGCAAAGLWSDPPRIGRRGRISGDASPAQLEG